MNTVIKHTVMFMTLGKNLGKILTKKFRDIQDSYQELQEFLHWVVFHFRITIVYRIRKFYIIVVINIAMHSGVILVGEISQGEMSSF